MKKYLSLLLVLSIIFSLLVSPAYGVENANEAEEQETSSFEENYSGILSLLGTGLVDTGMTISEDDLEYDELINQNIYKIDLENGGYLEVNEKQEIVRVRNFGITNESKSLSTLEDAITTIESELNLDNYTITKNELFADDRYRLTWEKQVGGYLNAHDSVHVLFDVKTMQLVNLKHFNFVATESEPILSQSEALKKAMPYLEGHQDNKVEITYVRPLLDINNEYEPQQGKTVNLAYVFTNDEVSVSVDVLTGDVISLAYALGAPDNSRSATAKKAARCFMGDIRYSSAKASRADDGFLTLGYETSSIKNCSSAADANTVISFWKGNNNYGFYITCHATASYMTDKASGGNFHLYSSSVPAGGIWNFVFLDGCSTAESAEGKKSWVEAFGITNSSKDRVFIGFIGKNYDIDSYNFAKAFWPYVGTMTLKECFEDAATIDTQRVFQPVFIGDSSYYGRV